MVDNVCVIGLGFVGLSMSSFFSSKGISVMGVDNNPEKISKINKGNPPFFEPKLDNLLSSNLGKTFQVTSNLKEAVLCSNLIFVCVGTPSNSDGSANLSFLQKICEELGKILQELDDYKIIIIKSTVPPTTTNNLVQNVLEKFSLKHAGKDFGLCMNPEFLREGSAVDDMISPHLIVIGVNEDQTKKTMTDFYKNLYQNDIPIVNTNITNAELIKYANNSFLATKISFINTIANICNKIQGANVEIIAKAIGYDPRIGPLFLKAGPGFGGSCFPKDVSGFVNFSHSLGYNPILLESTQKVNQDQVQIILNMIEKNIDSFEGKKIAILGLAFKNNTDDIRESVSIKIVESLLEKNSIIKVHDPMAIENFRRIFQDKITYFKEILDCVKDTECCVILTDWEQYQNFSEEFFKNNMTTPCVIDTRRVMDPSKIHSIQYDAIGIGADHNQ